jgi:hypothetical protein
MHILQALRERKSEQALFETCTYLSSSNTDALEDEWIAVLAEIGMSGAGGVASAGTKDLWTQCIYDVKALIDSDAIDVTDALICTTKLYLLYIRTATPISASLAQLRARVLEHFPAGTRLSYKGVMLYDQIIPDEASAGAELHEFAHRILSGFIKLFHNHSPLTASAVEFIARKKIVIPCKRVWPAPNPQEAAKGDPVWFVWGAVLLYFPNDFFVQVAWSLYSKGWKKKDKMERLGLLVGTAACVTYDPHLDASLRASDMIDTGSSGWTSSEAAVIENISQLAPDLWASHSPPPKISTASAPSLPSNAAQINPADVLEEFVPLRIESRAAPPAQNTPLWDNGEFHLKVIDVAEENENGRSRKASKAK